MEAQNHSKIETKIMIRFMLDLFIMIAAVYLMIGLSIFFITRDGVGKGAKIDWQKTSHNGSLSEPRWPRH